MQENPQVARSVRKLPNNCRLAAEVTHAGKTGNAGKNPHVIQTYARCAEIAPPTIGDSRIELRPLPDTNYQFSVIPPFGAIFFEIERDCPPGILGCAQ